VGLIDRRLSRLKVEKQVANYTFRIMDALSQLNASENVTTLARSSA